MKFYIKRMGQPDHLGRQRQMYLPGANGRMDRSYFLRYFSRFWLLNVSGEEPVLVRKNLLK